MSLMGLDVGTTGCKALAFDEDGRVIAGAYREYPLLNPQPGWYELDPEAVWHSLADCIRAVNAQTRGDPVRALAVSAQGEAVIPVGRGGEVLTNSPVTSDLRALDQTAEMESRFGRERLYALTGQPLHPMYTLPKILWWRDCRPEVFAATWKFLLYGDFILLKLGLEPVVDFSMAARTLAFNVHAGTWSGEILGEVGLDETLLARPLPSGSVLDELPTRTAAELGFAPGVLAVTGGHDQPCGALGAGVVKAGEAMYAIGTTECIAPVFPHPVRALGQDNFPCYPHVAPGAWISLAGNQTGGRLLRWYRDTLGSEEVRLASETGRDVFDVILGQVGDRPSGLLVLPFFAGSSSLENDPLAKGAILGLTFSATRADLVKAILEGVTYAQALSAQRMQAAGVRINCFRAVGGGARSPLWLQMKADILNRPVAGMAVEEAASLGAAQLAGWAAGVYPSLEAAAQTVRIRRVYEPDPSRSAEYRSLLGRYAESCAALAHSRLT